MSKIDHAIHEFQTIEQMAKRDGRVNRIHPLVKLCLTVLYIAAVVSFPKYNLAGAAVMAVYPIVLFNISGVSFADAVKRLRIVLPLVLIVGILNPFFDRRIVLEIGALKVSGGVLSMLTLMIKAVLTVFSSYLLIATTPIEEICCAMNCIRIPQVFVIEVLLIYRYITVLLSEARRVTDAYLLRAPGQKGIAFRAWGPLAGQMLMRSMDRAEQIYESMRVRGFNGQFRLRRKGRNSPFDIIYFLVWVLVFITLRFLPVLEMVGRAAA